MRWLAFGTYDVHRHPRVGVLIEGLRASGDEVTEVNVPLALDTAGRVAMLRQPWRLPKLAWMLARCWTLLAVRSRRARRERPDAVLVGYLGHFDVRLARRLFPRTPIVLDHLVSAAGTARDRGLTADAAPADAAPAGAAAPSAGAASGSGGGIKAKLMRAIDKGALASADVVVVDTDEHLAALPVSAADRGVVAPVGAGAAWFAAGAERRERQPDGPLKAIFVGLFTPLHGTETLGAALAELAGDDRIEVTMVGKGQDYEACRAAAAANPRVTWIDWVTADELPGLVAAHDVSLGIFGTTDKAQNVVPTKVFQGAAAACAIVTSDTAPQRRALGDDAVFVAPGDAAGLAAALRALAGDRDLLAGYQEAARRRAGEKFAADMVVAGIRARVTTPPTLSHAATPEIRTSTR